MSENCGVFVDEVYSWTLNHERTRLPRFRNQVQLLPFAGNETKTAGEAEEGSGLSRDALASAACRHAAACWRQGHDWRAVAPSVEVLAESSAVLLQTLCRSCSSPGVSHELNLNEDE